MPNFTIAALEKAIVQAYFSNPAAYVDEKEAWRFESGLPHGLKLSRFKPIENPGAQALKKFREEGIALECRYFILPGTVCVKIPIAKPITDDPGEHSCTVLQMVSTGVIRYKMFFHQNAEDLPEVQRHRTLDESESTNSEAESESVSDSDSSDNSAVLRVRAFFEALRLAKKRCRTHQKDYFKIGHKTDVTVKWVVDKDDIGYVVKRDAGIPGQPPTLAVTHVLPSLYLCVDFIRNAKTYSFMYFKGESFYDFLLRERETLSLPDKDQLSLGLLTLLDDLKNQNIVHTDLKACNLCMQVSPGAQMPYTFHCVDDAEAFQGANTLRGKGTRGYYPPEFFASLPDSLVTNTTPPRLLFYRFIEWQMDPANNAAALLKPNVPSLFSPASDAFAIGCLLLNGLNLPPESRWYKLAHKTLCALDPAVRGNYSAALASASGLNSAVSTGIVESKNSYP